MTATKGDSLSQALMGLAVVERAMVPERGGLVDELLESIRGGEDRYEELKAMYLQLLYAASVLATYAADSSGLAVSELLDQVKASMVTARLNAGEAGA